MSNHITKSFDYEYENENFEENAKRQVCRTGRKYEQRKRSLAESEEDVPQGYSLPLVTQKETSGYFADGREYDINSKTFMDMKKETICSAILAVFTMIITLAIFVFCVYLFPESLSHTYWGILWFFGSFAVSVLFEQGFIYVVRNAKFY